MLIVNLKVDKSNLNFYISNTLLEKIEKNIEKNKKIIIYLNKRWEFSSLICKDCSKIYKCDNCDFNLSVHKNPEKLVCHLCSHTKEIPLKCYNCNWTNLEKIWVWTQQIEISLKKYFKDKKIYRFDTDNIKNISDKKKALDNLEKADIIIWTKMITTWFNIKNLGLIAVLLLEQELSIPVYDVEERIYSNIKQLIWRWNRYWEETETLIQTFIPENELIKSITNDNYKNFFKKVLNERKDFSYPPYCEMATIEYRNKDKQKAKDFIEKIKNKLENINNKETSNQENKTVKSKWSESKIEINLINNPIRKYNSYHYKIIVKTKWEKWNIRKFLEKIKQEIIRNKWLIVIFE